MSQINSFKSYKKQIDGINGKEAVGTFRDCSYEEALIQVKKYIQEKKLKNDDIARDDENTKDFLRIKKNKYRQYIRQATNDLKLRVDEYSSAEFIEEALADIVGYSILEDAFADPEITDIFVNSEDDIVVEKAGKNVPYWRKFRSESHYLETAERFLKESGKELNAGDKKITHFEIYGDRGCAIDKSIATRQLSLTFRKHGYTEVTAQDLLDYGVMTKDMADLLGVILQGELNLTVAGITGSGKTTSLQAIVNHYLNSKRILIAEDTQELEIECTPENNNNVLQLVSFKGKTPDETVDLGELVYTALRLKPRTILVGEIRSVECMAATEAAETGHSVAFTIHGGSPTNVVNRIVTKYMTAMPSLGIDVVERIIGSALDYIMVQDAIPNIGRRVTTIAEVSYDFSTRRIKITPIYKFNFKTNQFEKLNNLDPEKVEVMYRRGITESELKRWID